MVTHTHRPWPRAGIISFLCVLLSACIDTNLMALSRERRDAVNINDIICTHHPEPSKTKTKILFLLDASESVKFSNFKGYLSTIEEIVTRPENPQTLYFSITRFGSAGTVDEVIKGDPQGQKFINDKERLQTIIEQMRNMGPELLLDATDYEVGLKRAREYVTEDIAQATAQEADTRYVIIFLTDGVPAAGPDANTTRNNILDLCNSIATTTPAKLDVYEIYSDSKIIDAFLNLTEQMAERGQGRHYVINTPGDLFMQFQKYDFAKQSLIFHHITELDLADKIPSLFVDNPHQVITVINGKLDQYLDSDGDGLPDALELDPNVGTHPQYADTDLDGLNDLFEYMHRPAFDPKSPHFPPLTAEQLADEDGDGLNLFMENFLGTDPKLADTDGDGVDDGTEVRFGTDPKNPDMSADNDLDGVPNGLEIFMHTNPNVNELKLSMAAGDRGFLTRNSYLFGQNDPPYKNEHGDWCYPLDVRNVTIGRSLPARGELDITQPYSLFQTRSVNAYTAYPMGHNRIRIVMLDEPTTLGNRKQSPLGAKRLVIGEAYIIYRPGGRLVRTPPALQLSTSTRLYLGAKPTE